MGDEDRCVSFGSARELVWLHKQQTANKGGGSDFTVPPGTGRAEPKRSEAGCWGVSPGYRFWGQAQMWTDRPMVGKASR